MEENSLKSEKEKKKNLEDIIRVPINLKKKAVLHHFASFGVTAIL